MPPPSRCVPRHGRWAKTMDDKGAEDAVQASLDGALEDLLRAGVESRTERSAASCVRIDAVFDHRMAQHRHLAWALAEAETLKRRLKAGLHGHIPDAAGRANGASGGNREGSSR